MTTTITRVLAIGAHPGDAAVLCGGTLARFAALGAHISMAAVSDGAAGNPKMPLEHSKLAAMRRKHETAAAAILKADLHWLGLEDGMLAQEADLYLKLVELVRAANPDLVITHNPQDFHTDNRVVSLAAFAACRNACLHNLATQSPPLGHVPALYYTDSWISRAFQPTEYVDISGAFAAKRRMVACNRIGVQWLRKFDGLDIFDLIQTHAKWRGLQSGGGLAEAFALDPNWPCVPTLRLLP